VDCPHRRGGGGVRPQLQQIHARPQVAGIGLDRKILSEIAYDDAPAFANWWKKPKPLWPRFLNQRPRSHSSRVN